MERGWFSHQSPPKGGLTAVIPSHCRAVHFIIWAALHTSAVQISGEISRVGATGRYYCKALQLFPTMRCNVQWIFLFEAVDLNQGALQPFPKVSGNRRNNKIPWIWKVSKTTKSLEIVIFFKGFYRFLVSRHFWIQKVLWNRRNDKIPWKVLKVSNLLSSLCSSTLTLNSLRGITCQTKVCRNGDNGISFNCVEGYYP